MPRPHQPRSVGGETNLAERIARERERREFSYEGLAKAMTAAGCPMQGSAIYKIEKGAPPRRISVDELVAFSAVFETTPDDLLTPVEVLDQQRGQELLREMDNADHALIESVTRFVQVYTDLVELSADNADLYEYVFGHFFAAGESADELEHEHGPGLFSIENAPGYDPRRLSQAFIDFRHRLIDEAADVAERSTGVQDDG